MTDFIFSNFDGSISAVVKTDLINYSGNSLSNFTIMQVVGIDNDAEKTVFGALKIAPTNTENLIQFALANALKVNVIVVGGSNFLPIALVPQLDSVASFAGTAAAGGIINLSWNALPTATNYVIEKSTSADFTVAKTQVYSGSLLLKQITGLANSTQYYFRIKAQGSRIIDSNWSVINITTLSS